nr:threonine/serine exporter family protein [Lysobacter sp.]
LEGAVSGVAQRLQLDCEPWSSPTALILTFSDRLRPPGASDATRVIRVAPGENDLHRLSETDRIAENVLASRIGLAAGRAAMAALDKPRGRAWDAMQVLGFGMAAASVAGLLRLPWLDITVCASTGLLIGLLIQLAGKRPGFRDALDAVAAMIAASIAILVATFVAPLNQNTVIIASLIVMLPGLALTNAINELGSQHLVAGTARFAGAITTVLKLTVGVAIAMYLANLLGFQPQVRAWRPQPNWVHWASLGLAAFSFAVLFRAGRRDFLLVMAAVVSGYLISRYGGLAWGSPAGIFLAALVMTAAGNAYARWWHRPGAIIRVPGIILLVPGSASLRGLLNLVQQQDASADEIALIAVMNILMALIAGLLFGNLLLPPRRNL